MSYLPLDYFADFVRFLDRRRAEIEVITYDDLAWSDDWDYRGHYPLEAAAWRSALRAGKRDPHKAYVLLQHDVDSHPQRTLDVLKVEADLGIRSNVMIFNRRMDRKHLNRTGEVRERTYFPDYGALKEYEKMGFVIGYHCNAYERSGYSREEAKRMMCEDIDELQRNFSLHYMSAHGGPVGPDGKSNNSLEMPSALACRVRWVHNGYGIFVDAGYSDGGISSGRRPAESFDLRPFVRALRPGGRYRILTHPQYYAKKPRANPSLRAAWYEEVLASYAATPPRNVWDNIELGEANELPSTTGWKSRLQRFLRRLPKWNV